MNGKQLKNSILQWAIQGKLVPQDPNDEPASVLLEKIRKEKERLIKEKKIKRDKNASIIYRGDDNSHYEKILATGEVKCIDDEVPFEIPKGWEWARMQEVITFVNGRAYKKEELLSRGKYKVLRVGNFFTNNQWYYSDLELSEDKYCYQGDLLYAWSASFGPQIWNGDKTIFHYHIWNVKFDTKVLFREYLYYFFLFDKTQVKTSTTGSTMVHVSMENMKPRLIPIPPVDEQKRIVCEVERVLPYIEKYELSQSKKDILDANIKESLKKSILQEALQGKLVPQIAGEGTAQELLEQIKAEKRRLVKEGKLKKSALNDSVIFRGDDNKYYEQVGKKCLDITEKIPFEIPKSWQWIRFDQGISLLSGRDLEPSRYNDLHHGIPYITGASNFVNSDLLVNRWTDSPITISDKGDLLLTCKGTIGSMAFNNIGQIHIARQVMAITSFGIDLKYIKCFLQSNLSILEKNANSMIPGISRNTLLDMLFPLPPIKEQQRIVAQIEKLFEQLR